MSEEYRVIYGTDYLVSDLGNVISLKGGVKKPLKKRLDSKGYELVDLYTNGKRKTYRVHQLVAMCFLGHTLNDKNIVVDHLDFDKSNNRVSNLSVVTRRRNTSRRQNSTSKYHGVCWCRHHKKWKAYIMHNNNVVSLGYHHNELDASDAVNKYIKEHDIKVYI